MPGSGGPERRGVDVTNFGVVPVDRPANLTRLEQLASPLAELSKRLALLMDEFPLLATITLRVLAEPPLAGEIRFTSASPGASLEVDIEGQLGRDIARIPEGTPFAPRSDGTVYFQSNPGRPVYARSGDKVVKGQTVLWFMGVEKNTQYGIPAHESGTIAYTVKNEQQVKAEKKDLGPDGREVVTQEATILFYIKPDAAEELK